MRKGYLYTLEALIGIALILISVVVVFSSIPAAASSGVALVKRQGFEALEFLEQKDELRPLVLAGNRAALKQRLRDLLPPTISIDADICTSGCYSETPADRTVVSIDYYVAGYHDTFFTKKVKLWMWGSF